MPPSCSVLTRLWRQAKGNAAFSAGDYSAAVAHFTDAIAVDPSNHVLYSNRSAAQARAAAARAGSLLRRRPSPLASSQWTGHSPRMHAAHASDDVPASSGAQAGLGKYTAALEDAQKVLPSFFSPSRVSLTCLRAAQTVELKPDWPKGFSRLGAAHHGLHAYDEARKWRLAGALLRLTPPLRPHAGCGCVPEGPGAGPVQRTAQGWPWGRGGCEGVPQLSACSLRRSRIRSQDRAEGGAAGGLGNLFTAPDALSKVLTNPSTRAFMQQPDFVAMFTEVQKNPASANKYINDPRMMQVLGVLLGMNISSAEPGQPTVFSKPGQAAPEVPDVEMSGAQRRLGGSSRCAHSPSISPVLRR